MTCDRLVQRGLPGLSPQDRHIPYERDDRRPHRQVWAPMPDVGETRPMNQLALDLDVSLGEKFERFHGENPNVYRTLVRLAREWVNQTGRSKIGIKSLYEVARWHLAIETSDPEYRLNNNYTAFYSRLIMLRESDLDGVFDLRCSEADDWLHDYLGKTA